MRELQVLVQPLKSLRGTRVWRKVFSSWLLALVFAIPQLFIFVQTQETRSSSPAFNASAPRHSVVVHGCKSAGYTAEWQRKVYFTFMTSYILIIPTCIMTFCYVKITCVIWLSTDQSNCSSVDLPRIHFVTSRRSPDAVTSLPRHGCTSGHRPHPRNSVQSQDDHPRLYSSLHRPATLISPSSCAVGVSSKSVVTSKRNVVKMTMSVIVGFVVCWTPYFVVSLIRIYSDYRSTPH